MDFHIFEFYFAPKVNTFSQFYIIIITIILLFNLFLESDISISNLKQLVKVYLT